MAGKESIRTGVDGFVELLEGKGKVSLPDASKQLGVPQSTLESWVDFLVEEGKVEVDYKFTTPYVYMKKHSDDEDDDDLSIREEDLGSDVDMELSSDSGQEMQEKSQHGGVLSLDKLSQLIEEGNIDSAYHEYMKLKTKAEGSASEEEMKKLISLNQRLVSKIDEVKNNVNTILSKMDSIISKLSQDLSKDDMGSAKVEYSELLSLHDSIPSILSREKASAYGKISYAYRMMEDKEHEIAESTIASAEKKVQSIRATISKLMKQGDMAGAQEYYDSLCSLYEYLPENLLAEKLKIYNIILKVHREIVLTRKFEELRDELNNISSDIDDSKTDRPETDSTGDDQQHIKKEEETSSGSGSHVFTKINEEKGKDDSSEKQHITEIPNPGGTKKDTEKHDAQIEEPPLPPKHNEDNTAQDSSSDGYSIPESDDIFYEDLPKYKSDEVDSNEDDTLEDIGSRHMKKEFAAITGFDAHNVPQEIEENEQEIVKEKDTAESQESADAETADVDNEEDTEATGLQDQNSSTDNDRDVEQKGNFADQDNVKDEEDTSRLALEDKPSMDSYWEDTIHQDTSDGSSDENIFYGPEKDAAETIGTDEMDDGETDDNSPIPGAPSVDIRKNTKEPPNPDLVFSEPGPEVVEDIPSRISKPEDSNEDDEYVHDMVVEEMAENFHGYPDDRGKSLRVLSHSFLHDQLSDDEMMRQGIEAYNNKDYFMAKHIFELIVKNDSSNVRARQMRDLIRGILADRDDEYYLVSRLNNQNRAIN